MLNKPADTSTKEPEYGDGETEEDENYVTADEPPSIALGDAAVNTQSSFSKLIETQIEKFKYQLPPKKETDCDKKNCGNGKISI